MRNRNNVIVIYMDGSEKAKLDKNVVASGLSRQTFCLKALMGREIKPRPCEHHAAFLKVFSDISNHTHHILQSLRSTGSLTESEADLLEEQIHTCWTQYSRLVIRSHHSTNTSCNHSPPMLTSQTKPRSHR